MRKISEILIEERQTIDREPLSSRSQSLVLFDKILDAEKVIQSQEIQKIVSFFYGRPALSIVLVDNPEKLHDWFRDEQYKADVQNRAMTYPFKSNFEDYTLPTYSNQYCGPLYVQMFSSGATEYDVLTITCPWSDGIFLNDYYVVGAIVDTEDLEKIAKDVVSR